MARAKKGTWVREWRGGRVWRAQDGTETYYIRRTLNGRRYDLSTRCTTEVAAFNALERFEKDPDAFHPEGDPATAPVHLDNELAVAYLAFCRDEQENSRAWLAKKKNLLAWWMERLAGVNLRKVERTAHLDPALDRTPGRAHKIRILKHFFAWLVETERIRPHEDPTFRRLKAPQAKPAQRKKSKVVPPEHVLLVIEHLTSPWREALTVQAGTGWHTTEVIRFAAAGEVEPLPKRMKIENGAAGVLVCPLHKSGDVHRTAVSQEVVDAAVKLLEHAQARSGERAALREARGQQTVGAFSQKWYDRAVKAACAAVKRPDGGVGIPAFTGAMMRHTNATIAVAETGNVAATSAFLGHKSPTTTKKFYAVHAVVPKVPTVV